MVERDSGAPGTPTRPNSESSANGSGPPGRGSIEEHLAPLPAELAIRGLFLKHRDFVYGIGLRICRDPDCAEDLVQETFMRALQGWDGFEGRARYSTWLYTIALRTNKRLHRRRSGEPRMLDCICKAERVRDPDQGGEPYDAAERTEKAERVRHAIDRLPIRYRLPLVLTVYSGLPARPVADFLNIREGTLRSRLYRARQLLAAHLEEPYALTVGRIRSAGNRESDSRSHDRRRPPSRRSRAEKICSGCRPVFVTTDAAEDFCRVFASEWLPNEEQNKILDLLSEPDASD